MRPDFNRLLAMIPLKPQWVIDEIDEIKSRPPCMHVSSWEVLDAVRKAAVDAVLYARKLAS